MGGPRNRAGNARHAAATRDIQRLAQGGFDVFAASIIHAIRNGLRAAIPRVSSASNSAGGSGLLK